MRFYRVLSTSLFVFGIGLLPTKVLAFSLLDVGVEVQGYPAGVMLGARGSFAIADHHEFNLRAAYNLTDRRDFGENDNEEGGGPGGGVGYRYYLKEDHQKWLFGGRVDLWFMEIDWRNDDGSSGETDIVVLQPTVEAGYLFVIGDHWTLSVTGAFGFEINVDTSGRDVGEGPIGLVGIVFSRRAN